jgi:hypothetical protein
MKVLGAITFLRELQVVDYPDVDVTRALLIFKRYKKFGWLAEWRWRSPSGFPKLLTYRP